MAPESLTFSVAALPLELRPDGAHAEDRWVPWFSGLNEPVRFLAWTDPFDMETPRQRLRAARQPLDQAAQGYAPIAAIVESWDRQAVQRLERAMGLLPPALRTVLLAVLPQAGWDHRAVWQRALAQLGRPLWRRDWLKAYERFYGVLAEHGELRTVKHALMTWPSHGERPATAATMLSQALGTTVRPDTLPPFLPGTYTDAFTHLQPHDPQHPYLALLVADSWEGMWTPLTFARLLDQPADIRLCVDIVPLDRAWTEQRVEFVAVSAENRMRDPNAPRDVKAEGALTTARQFQEQADQGFFALRAVVAVGARDRARLEEAVRAVSLSMRSVLRLIRPNGGQGRLVSFFSDTATDDINAFAPARTDVGKGAAVSLPIGIRRPAATDGILWMLEGQTPIFFHPVLDEHGRKRAGHVVVLGLPGNGKTTAAFAWALRLATALNGQVIFVEPNEHASRLVERAGAAGVYHRLDLSQRINILDVAVGRDPDGRPPPVSAQIQVVLTQLSVLLGRAGINAQQQQTFEPRVLNEMQLSLLDLALQAVYAPWADKLDELRPEETPILSDLVAALRALTIPSEVEHDRARLVAELEMRLVQGSLGSTYNARSTVQWDFQHDLTAFNLTALAEGVPRILYTFQLFAAITRYARGRPDPERPLFVFFDEFGASLRGIPGLAAFVLDCMKVLRTFLTAVIAMDQLWSTFKDQPLRAIWEAAAIHVYFAQQLENAKEIVSAEDALSEEFAPVIARQGLGECVMVWNPTAAEGGGATEVFQGRVQLSPEELLHLPEPRPTRAGTR